MGVKLKALGWLRIVHCHCRTAQTRMSPGQGVEGGITDSELRLESLLRLVPDYSYYRVTGEVML